MNQTTKKAKKFLTKANPRDTIDRLTLGRLKEPAILWAASEASPKGLPKNDLRFLGRGGDKRQGGAFPKGKAEQRAMFPTKDV